MGELRWRIEHDYRELKTGLGLHHYEGLVRLPHLQNSLPHKTKNPRPSLIMTKYY